MLRISSTAIGSFAREVELNGVDIELGPLAATPIAKTLEFVDANTHERLSFSDDLGDIRNHFLELVSVTNGQAVVGAMDTSTYRDLGPGEEGWSLFLLSPGIYRVRLQSTEWASPFVLIDARDGDSSIAIPCSRLTPVTLVPAPGFDWSGAYLTLRSGDGNVLDGFSLTGPEARTVRCLLGWTEARVENVQGRLLARRKQDRRAGAQEGLIGSIPGSVTYPTQLVPITRAGEAVPSVLRP